MRLWLLSGFLLIVLLWVTRLKAKDDVRLKEHFDGTLDAQQMITALQNTMSQIGVPPVENGKEPALLQKLQGMLNTYGDTKFLDHVNSVKDKDPGQLARTFLNISNQ
jgi:hypothetical protein